SSVGTKSFEEIVKLAEDMGLEIFEGRKIKLSISQNPGLEQISEKDLPARARIIEQNDWALSALIPVEKIVELIENENIEFINSPLKTAINFNRYPVLKIPHNQDYSRLYIKQPEGVRVVSNPNSLIEAPISLTPHSKLPALIADGGKLQDRVKSYINTIHWKIDKFLNMSKQERSGLDLLRVEKVVDYGVGGILNASNSLTSVKKFINNAEEMLSKTPSGTKLLTLLSNPEEIRKLRNDVDVKLFRVYEGRNEIDEVIINELERKGIDFGSITLSLINQLSDKNGLKDLSKLNNVIDIMVMQLIPDNVPVYRSVGRNHAGLPGGIHNKKSDWGIGKSGGDVVATRYKTSENVIISSTFGELRKVGILTNDIISNEPSAITLVHRDSKTPVKHNILLSEKGVQLNVASIDGGSNSKDVYQALLDAYEIAKNMEPLPSDIKDNFLKNKNTLPAMWQLSSALKHLGVDVENRTINEQLLKLNE
ncbi:MAG: hypothetical protein KAJ14_10110, partial [Candidatus Omnitrophica bacterium]|nr:hypothetical protein [Candidatus Omnitrophota bacterium]